MIYKLRHTECGETAVMKLPEVLEYINSYRNEEWIDYDETDWREGLSEFTDLEVVDEINVGDEIVFKSPTRSGYRKAKRKITGFRDYGPDVAKCATVTQYHGWKDFAVKLDEIISVEKWA